MGANPLKFEVAVGLDGAVEGLRVLSRTTEQSANQIRNSLSNGIGQGAKEAEKAHGGLLSAMREFKQEQTQQGRVASFYAAQLAEIIPGANGARQALQSLVAIGLEGFGIGAAIEITTLALSKLAESINEHNANMAELRKLHFDTWSQIAESMRNVGRQFDGPISKTEEAWRGLGDTIKKQLDELKFKRNELEQDPGIFRNAILGWTAGLVDLNDNAIEQTIRKIKQLQGELTTWRAEIERTNAATKEYVSAFADGTQKTLDLYAASANELVKIRRERDRQLAELEKNTPDADPTKAMQRAAIIAAAEERIKAEKLRREREHAAAVLQMQSDVAASRDRIELDSARRQVEIRERYRPLLASGTDAEIALAKKRMDAELAEEKKVVDEKVRLEEAARQKILADALRTDDAATRARIEKVFATQKEIEEKARGTFDKINSWTEPVAGALGEIFVQAVQGAKDWEQAVAQTAKSALKSIIDMATKATIAHIVAAEAGAAESQSWIPGIGPILAVGAVASIGAALSGLVGMIPSASGGFDIPKGVNPLTQLHGGEMVLPEKQADVIRELADGGGGAVGGMTINISAVDAAGVRRLVESGDFQRALREAARNGRGA